MQNKISIYVALTIMSAAFTYNPASAQTDTLRLMAYNVLYYGDTPPCQAPHSTLHGYLETIVAYAQPDVLSLEKMAAIPMYTGDHSGTAPAGFADSVVQFALNAALPGTYAYCPYSNTAGGNNMCILFYNQNKLGYISTINSYSNITDFNTYKMYYKSPGLAYTHDTAFLYFTLNHDNSGSDASDAAIRGGQIDGYMDQLQTLFTHLPNMVNMGDFNTHNSSEVCYQRMVAPADTGFLFYDPYFYPDAIYSYPADWDDNPNLYPLGLTTSTRLSGSVPNSCGTSGGAKSWYDHIFLSSDIINNVSKVQYIPNSYKTLGNDGSRLGISVNDSPPVNTSAPAAVINALFQMSNKYPIMADLAVTTRPAQTAITEAANESITVCNPVGKDITLYLNLVPRNEPITMQCTDMLGRVRMTSTFAADKSYVQIPCGLTPGNYLARFYRNGQLITTAIFTRY